MAEAGGGHAMLDLFEGVASPANGDLGGSNALRAGVLTSNRGAACSTRRDDGKATEWRSQALPARSAADYKGVNHRFSFRTPAAVRTPSSRRSLKKKAASLSMR